MAATVESARVAEIHDSAEDLDEKVERLAELVRDSKYTVLFTGAGVSTASGIPDYRGPSGCWTRRRIQELEERGSRASEADRTELEKLMAEQQREMAKSDPAVPKVPKEFVEPGFSHMAIATMLHNSLAHYVVTTNLDGLFRKAGLIPHQELCCLHGDVFVERCTGCGTDFERNYRVRRAGSHVHDHRASGSGICSRCNSATPDDWTGFPKGACSVKTMTVVKKPPVEAITVERVVANARRKWPGLVWARLASVNSTCVKDACDHDLRRVISEASLPLEIKLYVAKESEAKIETGGGTTFEDTHLVGTTEQNIGTKDTHINFGEGLDDIDWNEAHEHCKRADLCIVLGTSMSLRHVTHFPFMAKKTVIVNLQQTPDDNRCFRGLRLWSTCETMLKSLLQKLGIDDVEEPPPWRPVDAIPLEELRRASFSHRQCALAEHLEETARRREHRSSLGVAAAASA